MTGQGSPYIGAALDSAFEEVQAVVVLLTGDDIVKLNDKYVRPDDPDYEKNLSKQPRSNVLFEAGMAFGKDPKRTILVQVDDIKPISDLQGRHVLRIDNTPEKRREFAGRLEVAECQVDISGTDWLKVGNFQVI